MGHQFWKVQRPLNIAKMLIVLALIIIPIVYGKTLSHGKEGHIVNTYHFEDSIDLLASAGMVHQSYHFGLGTFEDQLVELSQVNGSIKSLSKAPKNVDSYLTMNIQQMLISLLHLHYDPCKAVHLLYLHLLANSFPLQSETKAIGKELIYEAKLQFSAWPGRP